MSVVTCPKCNSGTAWIVNSATGDLVCKYCSYAWSTTQVAGQGAGGPALPPINYNIAPLNYPALTFSQEEPLTREKWERQNWDTAAARAEAGGSEVQKLMLYFVLNRQGLRMDGIEKKIETLLTEKWKEAKPK